MPRYFSKASTRAICAVAALGFGASGAAAAEPLTLTTGGFMYAGLGYIDVSDGGDGFAVMRDGEIHFTAIGSTDNGLTFSARVELEAYTTEDQIDENWVKVAGEFGEIVLGGDDDAKLNTAVGVFYAPGSKIGYYDDDVEQGLTGVMDGGSDSIGIQYYTPRIFGFMLAGSYQPDENTDNSNDTNGPVYNGVEVWSAGANYMGSFNGYDVMVSAGYTHNDNNTNEDETYSFGGQVAGSNFSLATYYENNFDNSEDYVIGVSYFTGPWEMTVGWSQTGEGSYDTNTFGGWVSYQLAPGVSSTLGGAYANPDNDSDASDGAYVMGYVGLNF